MADKKSFLLRLPSPLMDALNLWARDDLRSLNGQIEFLLRESLRRAQRLPKSAANPPPESAVDPLAERPGA